MLRSPSNAQAEPLERTIRVGLTERHGMADEARRLPPPGVTYSFLEPVAQRPVWWIRSPIKGFLRHFESSDHDLLEAVLSPIVTTRPWVYSVENLQAPATFNFLGLPLPRGVRLRYLEQLFLQPNLKKLVVWSQAGLETFTSYGKMTDERILNKLTMVYPAVRRMPDDQIRFKDEPLQLLFSGDFFRKGGANVIDAFERAQQKYPSIRLLVCCDEQMEFNTPDLDLRARYLARIRKNPGITFGRVKREDMLTRILPDTDIFLLPTYADTFGFAALEAMSFGIPVITSNCFALPEMVEHGVSGFLIDVNKFGGDSLFGGYVVNRLPDDFREYMSEEVYRHLCALIESRALRESVGLAGLRLARTTFSIENRNERMREIYARALEE
jgi:glycosyltransferase involved in cell wall biosynthesis